MNNLQALLGAGIGGGASYGGGQLVKRLRRGRPRKSMPSDEKLKNAMWKPTIRSKLKSCNVMWTYARYHMHPINRSYFISAGNTSPYFTDGRGPLLASPIEEDVTSTNFGNITGTNVENHVGTTGHNQTAYSLNRYLWTYVFSADYPFNTMLPVCQKTGTQNALCHLTWETMTPQTTTDPNLPITLSDVVGNKDWNRITHGITYLYFDFSNYALQPMVVEVLLFRYLVDVDAMSYTQMIDAPLSRQYGFAYASYCEMKNMALGTPQIKVIKRIRFKMSANQYLSHNTNADGDAIRNNNIGFTPRFRKLKLKVRRQYSIKRPIATSYISTLTDNEFYNTYYEYDKGVYCRVQAWPEDNRFRMTREEIPNTTGQYYSAYELDNSYTNSNKLKTDAATTPTTSDYRIAQGVACYLEKKSFFKLDEPMLRGPFRT